MDAALLVVYDKFPLRRICFPCKNAISLCKPFIDARNRYDEEKSAYQNIEESLVIYPGDVIFCVLPEKDGPGSGGVVTTRHLKKFIDPDDADALKIIDLLFKACGDSFAVISNDTVSDYYEHGPPEQSACFGKNGFETLEDAGITFKDCINHANMSHPKFPFTDASMKSDKDILNALLRCPTTTAKFFALTHYGNQASGNINSFETLTVEDAERWCEESVSYLIGGSFVPWNPLFFTGFSEQKISSLNSYAYYLSGKTGIPDNFDYCLRTELFNIREGQTLTAKHFPRGELTTSVWNLVGLSSGINDMSLGGTHCSDEEEKVQRTKINTDFITRIQQRRGGTQDGVPAKETSRYSKGLPSLENSQCYNLRLTFPVGKLPCPITNLAMIKSAFTVLAATVAGNILCAMKKHEHVPSFPQKALKAVRQYFEVLTPQEGQRVLFSDHNAIIKSPLTRGKRGWYNSKDDIKDTLEIRGTHLETKLDNLWPLTDNHCHLMVPLFVDQSKVLCYGGMNFSSYVMASKLEALRWPVPESYTGSSEFVELMRNGTEKDENEKNPLDLKEAVFALPVSGQVSFSPKFKKRVFKVISDLAHPIPVFFPCQKSVDQGEIVRNINKRKSEKDESRRRKCAKVNNRPASEGVEQEMGYKNLECDDEL